jgi:hypothetical protein
MILSEAVKRLCADLGGRAKKDSSLQAVSVDACLGDDSGCALVMVNLSDGATVCATFDVVTWDEAEREEFESYFAMAAALTIAFSRGLEVH